MVNFEKHGNSFKVLEPTKDVVILKELQKMVKMTINNMNQLLLGSVITLTGVTLPFVSFAESSENFYQKNNQNIGLEESLDCDKPLSESDLILLASNTTPKETVFEEDLMPEKSKFEYLLKVKRPEKPVDFNNLAEHYLNFKKSLLIEMVMYNLDNNRPIEKINLMKVGISLLRSRIIQEFHLPENITEAKLEKELNKHL